MKLKSGALYLTLSLGICFMGYIGAVMLNFNLHQQLIGQQIGLSNSIDRAYNGIEVLKSMDVLPVSGSINYEESYLGDASDYTLYTEPWGNYTIGTAVSYNYLKNDTAQMLFGNQLAEQTVNLYIADINKPLALCGHSKISGTVSLPKAGVKRAYIEGQNFQYSNLIDGKQLQSDNSIPPLTTKNGTQEFNVIPIEVFKPGHYSFKNSTAIAHTDNYFLNDSLSGKLKIINTGKFVVGPNAYVEDLIIETDSLFISSGFHGNAQFFVKNKVRIAEEAWLAYPSYIEIKQGDKGKVMEVGKKAVLGAVCVVQADAKSEVWIEDDAKIVGGLHAQCRTSLKGTIQGFLYTHSFFLKTPSSYYTNHILNGNVLAALPEGYAYPNSSLTSNSKAIRWLD